MPRQRLIPTVLLGLVALLALPAGAEEWRDAKVIKVIDGDTVVLNTGEHVRLLDINAPEIAHDPLPADPYGPQAATLMQKLLTGQAVNLQIGTQSHDHFGRLLAHIYRKSDGLWVNGALVANGLATVYTFPDNATLHAMLLPKENAARSARAGLWSHPRWAIQKAQSCCPPSQIGLFTLVEGTPLMVGEARDRVYLNFGSDYRTDFTVEILRKDLKRYFGMRSGADLAAAYVGKKVRVRGPVKPVNGTLIRITHPAQIEVL